MIYSLWLDDDLLEKPTRVIPLTHRTRLTERYAVFFFWETLTRYLGMTTYITVTHKPPCLHDWGCTQSLVITLFESNKFISTQSTTRRESTYLMQNNYTNTQQRTERIHNSSYQKTSHTKTQIYPKPSRTHLPSIYKPTNTTSTLR